MLNSSRKAVSPVIAIVLLLMMTVAAAGAAYFWITSMQSSVQQSAGSQIEAITKQASTRIIAQATICKGINEVNLVGYWTIDDYNSTGVLDVSENNNFGTFEGTAFGTDNITGGQVGKALDFDGEDDYVTISSITEDQLDIHKSYTVSLWLKIRNLSEDKGILEIETTNGPIRISLDSGNYFNCEANTDTYVRYLWGGPSWELDEWYHMAVVVKPDSGEALGYRNGSLIFEDTFSSSGWNALGDANNVKIAEGYFCGRHNGLIDEVRIYDRALSKAQVEYLNDTNKAMGRYVDITVYNAGTEEVPAGAWVANLKKDGTTVDSDSYNASKLPPEERITLNFYFDKMKPNREYTIELEGTETSTTVSC